MTNKENYQNFEIKCLDSKNQKLTAVINVWIEKIENPVINDIIENKKYELQGKYNIFFLKYHDETGLSFENNSDRLSNAFYELCKKLHQKKIKMLIKGCSLGYYMIPSLQYSIYTTPLTLGKRIEKDFLRVNIFEPEDDIQKVVTIEEQKEYYNKWAESIKGLPYE